MLRARRIRLKEQPSGGRKIKPRPQSRDVRGENPEFRIERGVSPHGKAWELRGLRGSLLHSRAGYAWEYVETGDGTDARHVTELQRNLCPELILTQVGIPPTIDGEKDLDLRVL